MKRLAGTIVILALGFAAGIMYTRRSSVQSTNEPVKPVRKILYWHDPMHPAYRSDKPGIAPDCGMKLEPVYSDEAPAPAMPDGTVHINPDKQQLIGVRYGVVESTTGDREFRAAGKVAIDETRVARVHARIDGWIEQVFADFTGKAIEKGQPLLTIYSPEMIASQQEYLLALKSREVMKSSSLQEARQNSDSMVEAARRRLELFELGAAQIDEVTRTGQPIRNITIPAPVSGVVMTRNAFPRQRIMPDTELYTIIDLSRVWIVADVFESDAPVVRIGTPGTIRVTYTGATIEARVVNILPSVDSETRTLKVRLEAANPGLVLKPDMFVEVSFYAASRSRLTVPRDAVINTGLRATVFVDKGNGYLEPRNVETGEQFGDRVEIRSGVSAGERIVTSGAFLVDSESQLKAPAGHAHD